MMTRQPVCRGQSRRLSTRNLAASSGGCLSVVVAVWCIQDALWKMMCALMCWCPGWLVDCSIILRDSNMLFFPSQIGPSHYINQVIIFSFFPPPQLKLQFIILNARSLSEYEHPYLTLTLTLTLADFHGNYRGSEGWRGNGCGRPRIWVEITAVGRLRKMP